MIQSCFLAEEVTKEVQVSLLPNVGHIYSLMIAD